MHTPVSGFSKFTKLDKIDFLVKNYLNFSEKDKEVIKSFWHPDQKNQKIFDEFSENTITNYYFPYGLVPNVKINNELLCVPMVTEESSVVAAAAKAAKFWLDRGGFKTEIVGTTKVGQVHMLWHGESESLFDLFNEIKEELLENATPITANMKKRGGGVLDTRLIDRSDEIEGYYQMWVEFDTCDAMGANFINSVLENFGKFFREKVFEKMEGEDKNLEVVMAILSNYTPDCKVRAWVECPVEDLHDPSHEMDAETFARKIELAVKIATIDVNRATTHNKGIMNGVDSVVLATGNDFRAVEACAHTYAARNGRYESLTKCELKNGTFKLSIELPLALGTVGGLTALHPMARISLDILNHPEATRLMEVAATIGLAQNFAALRSLTTSGIQKGHMKMHLMNILNHLEATEEERELAKDRFANDIISFTNVREFIASVRNYQ